MELVHGFNEILVVLTQTLVGLIAVIALVNLIIGLWKTGKINVVISSDRQPSYDDFYEQRNTQKEGDNQQQEEVIWLQTELAATTHSCTCSCRHAHDEPEATEASEAEATTEPVTRH